MCNSFHSFSARSQQKKYSFRFRICLKKNASKISTIVLEKDEDEYDFIFKFFIISNGEQKKNTEIRHISSYKINSNTIQYITATITPLLPHTQRQGI